MDDLPDRLAEAKSLLEHVYVGDDVSKEAIAPVQDLLTKLLDALGRELLLTPLVLSGTFITARAAIDVARQSSDFFLSRMAGEFARLARSARCMN